MIIIIIPGTTQVFASPHVSKMITRDKQNPLPEYIYKAAEVAWSMLTVQPPMVIDAQLKFNKDLHEQKFREGHSRLKAGDNLVYYKPTLFRSYQGEIACKADVGNIPKASFPFRKHGKN